MRKPYPTYARPSKASWNKAVGLVLNIEDNRLFRHVFRTLSVLVARQIGQTHSAPNRERVGLPFSHATSPAIRWHRETAAIYRLNKPRW
jgi:hypothetical protein